MEKAKETKTIYGPGLRAGHNVPSGVYCGVIVRKDGSVIWRVLSMKELASSSFNPSDSVYDGLYDWWEITIGEFSSLVQPVSLSRFKSPWFERVEEIQNAYNKKSKEEESSNKGVASIRKKKVDDRWEEAKRGPWGAWALIDSLDLPPVEGPEIPIPPKFSVGYSAGKVRANNRARKIYKWICDGGKPPWEK